MTGVGTLAAIAGVLAAVGVVELLAVAGRPRGRGEAAAGPGGPAAERGGRRTGRVLFGVDERLHRDRRRRPGPASADRTVPAAHRIVQMLSAVGRRVPARPPAGLARRIDAAGLHAGVAEVMALKAGTGVTGLAVSLLLGSGAPGRLAWPMLVAGPLLGFLMPDAWLRRRTRARRRAMEQQLGDVLELLRVAVEAGLTVPRALGEVGRRHPGVLAAEIRHASGLQEWGMPQRQALAVLVSRCPTPGVATLAAALGRAERHGAPLGDALAAQAEEARARRARESIEAAARAAPKIQLIVALLLVPSAMLLMAAAMLPALAWR